MKKLIIILVLMLYVSIVKSQDPTFSQFLNNRSYYNPAFTGLDGSEISMSQRCLWPNLPGKFNTSMLHVDFDLPFNRLQGGGIMFLNDIEGEANLRTTTLAIPFSVGPYRMFVIDNRTKKDVNLNAGFIVGGMQKSITWDNMLFSDQLDHVNGNVRESAFKAPGLSSRFALDFSFGLMLEIVNSGRHTKGWEMRSGFAVHHLTQPDFPFNGFESKVPRKYVVHSDVSIPLSKTTELQPFVVYEKQSEMHTIQGGVNMLLSNSIVVGGAYRRFRNADAVTITAGSFFNNVQIAYSYDITVSGLMPVTGGAHEISLIFKFQKKQKCDAFKNGAD